MSSKSVPLVLRILVQVLIVLLPASAARAAEPVTVYCSADEQFARPILADFGRRCGVAVRPVFDTEAGKTTGLVHRLLAERGRPRADVWWSSEVFGTIQLAEAGVLAAYDPAAAADIPSQFRDPQHRWTGLAARARVLAYDPRRTPPDRLPRAWADLARPEFKGRLAMANPIFGTTRGQMAVFAARWGEAALGDYFAGLRRNEVRLADGNAQAVLLVARGVVELAATDTDDVLVAQARGDTVAIHFPDLDAPSDGAARSPTRDAPPARRGTVWIPNSVALVAGGPNPEGARALMDLLVSAEMERRLALSESANVPVRAAVRKQIIRTAKPRWDGSIGLPKLFEAFEQAGPCDFAAAAARLRKTDAMTKEILLR